MYELKIVRERRQGYGTVRRVRDAAQVYEAFREEFSQLDREMFVVLLLDGKNQVLGFLAPFVVVRRKSDGRKGSLTFSHSPRFYFSFREA